MDLPLYFQKVIKSGKGTYFYEKNSEKAKHPQVCLCLGGSMPKAQIKPH